VVSPPCHVSAGVCGECFGSCPCGEPRIAPVTAAGLVVPPRIGVLQRCRRVREYSILLPRGLSMGFPTRCMKSALRTKAIHPVRLFECGSSCVRGRSFGRCPRRPGRVWLEVRPRHRPVVRGCCAVADAKAHRGWFVVGPRSVARGGHGARLDGATLTGKIRPPCFVATNDVS
jgi:hypothetical protein